MNEPSPTLPPKQTSRLTVVLIGMAVLASLVMALTLGIIAWWWLHQSNGRAVNPDGNRSHPPRAATDAGVSVADLFNGVDLEGWEFDPAVWSVRNGVIYGHQKRSDSGPSLFWQGEQLTDFELHFRFRLVGGNSGVSYRATRLANLDVGGYEFEIYTNKTGNLADVGTDRERRRLYRAESTAPALDSEWHEGVITATGPHLVHQLDGKVLCDVVDTFPGAPQTGALAFGMAIGTTIEFRDIRLKRIRPAR